MALKIVEEMKSPYRATLGAFSRALAREAHVLTRQPDLLWQQLYNRLQWEASRPSRAVSPRARAAQPPRRPPVDPPLHRLRESEALVRTLTGHTDRVIACAVSPDGAWIVSASHD